MQTRAISIVVLIGAQLLGQVKPTHQDGRIRVFVGDSQTWEATSFGAGAATRSIANAMGSSHAGTVKLTVAVMKHLDEYCKTVTVVNQPENADLFIRMDHNRGMWSVHEDMAVFDRKGEMVFVASSVKVSRDVKQFCESPVFGPQPVKKRKHKP